MEPMDTTTPDSKSVKPFLSASEECFKHPPPATFDSLGLFATIIYLVFGTKDQHVKGDWQYYGCAVARGVFSGSFLNGLFGMLGAGCFVWFDIPVPQNWVLLACLFFVGSNVFFSAVIVFFAWFLQGTPPNKAVDEECRDAQSIIDPNQIACGHFPDLLRNISPDTARKWGNRFGRAVWALSIVGSLIASVAAFVPSWVSTVHPPIGPAVLVIALTWIAWFPWAFIFLSVLAVCLLSIVFMAEMLKEQATQAKTSVKSLLTTPRDKQSLDGVVRQRYAISLLIDGVCRNLNLFLLPILIGGSAFAYGLLWNDLSQESLNSMQLVWASAIALAVLVVLAGMAYLYPAGDALYRAMIEIRSQFPAESATGWVAAFGATRNDIDSIISHCKNTPIGFTVLGFVITPTLVQSIVYLLASLVSIIAQRRASV